MKTVLAIIVYNRFANLVHWMHCWKQCKQDAELVVIHTGDDREQFEELCVASAHVKYIHRKNHGFDIGCMQDVFSGRLLGFPEWDLILWCCDDTFPMSKDFIQPYIDRMQDPKVGIACMQISKSVAPHVRTTGFMIRRETARQIKFPADPVTTKAHCYYFEHRGGKDTLTMQVRRMCLDCVMLSDPRTSVMWDSAHPNARLRLDRQAEHDAVFNPVVNRGDKVTFICTIYNTYPQIISSLLLQTHENWELILIHDGPSENGMLSYIPDDPRVKYIETAKRVGNWGHSYRQEWLKKVDSDYVVVSNGDNYYTPAFCKSLLSGFVNSKIVASYCENMVHSYTGWGILNVSIKRGFIDTGGVMVRTDVAREVGWNDITSHSSDWTYLKAIADKFGEKNFAKIPGCHFIHN